MKRDRDNPQFFDLLVEKGFIEPEDISAEGEALYQVNVNKGWHASLGITEDEIRPFLQVVEQETIPGKIAPAARINAAALFADEGVLHSNQFSAWIHRYIRPIVRTGRALDPGQPEESIVPCWKAASGSRCHADVVIVRRPEDAIASLCPRCGTLTVIEFWQATPWNVDA